jgi:hypothetical protein
MPEREVEYHPRSNSTHERQRTAKCDKIELAIGVEKRSASGKTYQAERSIP